MLYRNVAEAEWWPVLYWQAKEHSMVPQCSVHTKEDSETRPFDCLSCQDRLPHLDRFQMALLSETEMSVQLLSSMPWHLLAEAASQTRACRTQYLRLWGTQQSGPASWMIDCTDSPLTPLCHEMRLFHFWRYPCSNREAKFLPFLLFL